MVRNKILMNFELATQVGTSEERRRQLLHFVVVGGGPTGVEFSAEFYDFFQQVITLHCMAASFHGYVWLLKLETNIESSHGVGY